MTARLTDRAFRRLALRVGVEAFTGRVTISTSHGFERHDAIAARMGKAIAVCNAGLNRAGLRRAEQTSVRTLVGRCVVPTLLVRITGESRVQADFIAIGIIGRRAITSNPNRCRRIVRILYLLHHEMRSPFAPRRGVGTCIRALFDRIDFGTRRDYQRREATEKQCEILTHGCNSP